MFSGPGGDYSAPLRTRYDRVLQLAQDDAEGRAAPRGGSVRIDTSMLDDQDRQDAERQRLAMTPGVRRGGSTATVAQEDSPLRVGASQRFERFGETYSYDPSAAAEEVGSTEAMKQQAADRTRFEALKKMPGFTEQSAARLVFGRGQPIDPDEANRALAEFVRTPNRGTAADAIARGASPYAAPFNPGFDTAIGERPRAPIRGTAEYRAEMQKESDIRAERESREIQLRESLKPPAKARTYRYVGDDKKEHVVNLDTGQEISVSPTALRPTAADENAALRKALAPQAPPPALPDKPSWWSTHWPGNRNAAAAPAAARVVTPPTGSPDAIPDDAIAAFIGADAAAPGAAPAAPPTARKPLTAVQTAKAAADPGYKAWLAERGYDVSRIR